MQKINQLATELGAALLARGQMVATAESCSGGMIGAAFTDIAGSSAWFGYGWISYCNQAKQALLGVSAQTLEAVGAVSERTVREMALGALTRSGADWSVAVSGIAGPSGGSETKPVGTVWFALLGPDCDQAFVRHFVGDRAAVRQQTVATALDALLTAVNASTLSA